MEAPRPAAQSRDLCLVPRLQRPQNTLVRQAPRRRRRAYAVSPIDLIPDFIPVLGVLDDLVIVPLGTLLAIKMVPKEVMAECREEARNAMEPSASKRTRCLVAATVVAIWCLLAALVILLAFRIADL